MHDCTKCSKENCLNALKMNLYTLFVMADNMPEHITKLLCKGLIGLIENIPKKEDKTPTLKFV